MLAPANCYIIEYRYVVVQGLDYAHRVIIRVAVCASADGCIVASACFNLRRYFPQNVSHGFGHLCDLCR